MIFFRLRSVPFWPLKQLVSVLDKFCVPFPGYYLYYPQRRQAPRVLRALIEYRSGGGAVPESASVDSASWRAYYEAM